MEGNDSVPVCVCTLMYIFLCLLSTCMGPQYCCVMHALCSKAMYGTSFSVPVAVDVGLFPCRHSQQDVAYVSSPNVSLNNQLPSSKCGQFLTLPPDGNWANLERAG